MKNLSWLVLGIFCLSILFAQENKDPKEKEGQQNKGDKKEKKEDKKDEKKNNQIKITTKVSQLRNVAQDGRKAYPLVDELVGFGEEAVEELLKLAKDPKQSLELRRLLTEALATIKSEKSLDYLKESAKSEDSWIRYHGITGLAALKKEQKLVEDGLASPDTIVKEAALRGLVSFSPTWEKTPKSVLEALETGDNQLTSSALHLLRNVTYSGKVDCLSSLNKLFKRDELMLQSKIEVIQTLTHFPQEESINLFVNYFDRETYDKAKIPEQERYWIQLTIFSSLLDLANKGQKNPETLKLVQKANILKMLKSSLDKEEELLRAKTFALLFTLFPTEKEILTGGLKDQSSLVQAVCIQNATKWEEKEAKPLLTSLAKSVRDPENQDLLVQSLTKFGMKEEEIRTGFGQSLYKGKWYPKAKAERMKKLDDAIKNAKTTVVSDGKPQVSFFTDHGEIVLELNEGSTQDATWHFLNCIENKQFDDFALDSIAARYITLKLPAEFETNFTLRGSIEQKGVEKGDFLMVSRTNPNFGGREFRIYTKDFPEFQNQTLTFLGKITKGVELLKEISAGDLIKKAVITQLPKAAREKEGEAPYFASFEKLDSEYFRKEADIKYREQEDLQAEEYWKKALELDPNNFNASIRLCKYYYFFARQGGNVQSAINQFDRLSRRIQVKQTLTEEDLTSFKEIAGYCAKLRKLDDVTTAQKDQLFDIQKRILTYSGN